MLSTQTAYRLVGMDLLPWTESDQNDYQTAFMSLLVRFVSPSLLRKSRVAKSLLSLLFSAVLSRAAAGIWAEIYFPRQGPSYTAVQMSYVGSVVRSCSLNSSVAAAHHLHAECVRPIYLSCAPS